MLLSAVVNLGLILFISFVFVETLVLRVFISFVLVDILVPRTFSEETTLP